MKTLSTPLFLFLLFVSSIGAAVLDRRRDGKESKAANEIQTKRNKRRTSNVDALKVDMQKHTVEQDRNHKEDLPDTV